MHQIGWQGVVRSANTFDPNKGASFATYAFRSIFHHVRRAVEVANQRTFRTESGQLISGDMNVGRPGGRTKSVFDLIGDERPHPDENPAERDRLATVRSKLADGLKKLPERLRTLLTLRFGLNGNDPMTLEETGNVLKVTRERVRQLERHAIERIRVPLMLTCNDLLNPAE